MAVAEAICEVAAGAVTLEGWWREFGDEGAKGRSAWEGKRAEADGDGGTAGRCD
jgi:hypothetical protein